MNQTALVFSAAGIRLGLGVSAVVEVVPSVRLVTPPEMPALLRGFLSMNRTLIPVLRLEKLLNSAAAESESDAPLGLADRLIIARLGGRQAAWAASADMEPLSYRSRETLPLPSGHVLNNCASQILPYEPPVILLNPDKLLTAAEQMRLDQLCQMTQERLSRLGLEPQPGSPP